MSVAVRHARGCETSVGGPFLLHLGRDGACNVMCFEFVDSVSVQTVVVVAVRMGEASEYDLAARFNTSFRSVPHDSSLVDEEECRLADLQISLGLTRPVGIP